MALAPWTGLPWSWLPSRKSSSLSSIQRQYPQVSNTVHSLTHYPIALPSITRSECQRRKGRYKAGLTGSKPAPKGPLGRSRSPEVQLDFWSPKNPEFWLSLPLLSLSLIDLHQFTQLWIHLFPTSKSEKVLDKVTSSEDALTSETKTPISMNREGCLVICWIGLIVGDRDPCYRRGSSHWSLSLPLYSPAPLLPNISAKWLFSGYVSSILVHIRLHL